MTQDNAGPSARPARSGPGSSPGSAAPASTARRSIARFHDEPDYQFEAGLNPRNTALRHVLADIRGHTGRLAELGCGSGRFLRAIQQHRPDLETIGIDLSGRLLAQAVSRGGGPRYCFGSITEVPLRDESFDIVVLFDVLEHVPDPERGVSEAARILRPGGVFHALVPCEGQPATLHWALWRLGPGADLKERHGGHIQRFTHGWVRDQFRAAGLRVEAVRYSMHPAGQVRDVLTYVAREDWFPRSGPGRTVHGAAMKALWAAGYVENQLLGRVPLSAVTMHVRAVKPGEGARLREVAGPR